MKGVARLLYEFEPSNYKLHLIPDRDKMTFDGTVEITGRKVGRPSQRLTFHQSGLRIKSVSLTFYDKRGTETDKPISRVNSLNTKDELRIHSGELLYPGNYKVKIGFSGHINEQMHGMYACNFESDGLQKKLIATQFESHHAREVFPCIDEPAAKATFDLTLTTPMNETVISNTPVNEQSGDEVLTTTFSTTPRMSTYLLAFTFGSLKYKEGLSGNGIKVRTYATPANYKLLDFSLSVAVKALDFFEDYFGTKYPLTKLDMVALPDFSAGAMENWGLITYRESCMLVDPDTSGLEAKQFAAIIICHEIAHQWFGNLVTMKWWDDLWLNESFANLMEYRAVDELFPEWNIWEHFVNTEFGSAQRRDCLPNVQPVRLNVGHPDEITTLFDPSIVYAKGSTLLRMLMHQTGEDKFKLALKLYFKKYSYQNTIGDDLWSALSEASGLDLKVFMDYWINAPGLPVVTIDHQPGSEVAVVRQDRLIIGAGTGSKAKPWPIPLSPSVQTDPQMLSDRQMTLTVKSHPDSPLFLNEGGRSYFVSNYSNPAHFKTILAEVTRNNLSIVDRMVLLQSYMLLERACLAATTSNLEMLLSYGHEQEESVWASMAGIIGTTRRLVFATEGDTPLKTFISFLVSPIIDHTGWEGRKGEPIQTQRLRELTLTLAASAENPEVIREGLKRFDNFKKPSDLASDVRSVVYYIGSRFGTKDDFQKMLSLYLQSHNSEEKEELCSALTSTRDSTNISRLISMLDTSKVRLQDVPTWFAYLISNPYSKDAAWDWMISHWQWLEKQYGQDKSQDRFPRYSAAAFSRESDLVKYKAFFEPKMNNRALRRVIKLGIEEISGRIKWRQKNETDTIAWLKNWSDNH